MTGMGRDKRIGNLSFKQIFLIASTIAIFTFTINDAHATPLGVPISVSATPDLIGTVTISLTIPPATPQKVLAFVSVDGGPFVSAIPAPFGPPLGIAPGTVVSFDDSTIYGPGVTLTYCITTFDSSFTFFALGETCVPGITGGVLVSTFTGGGGGDNHEPPTIGLTSDGVLQVVEDGICIDAKCWTVTEPFHQDFDLVEMLSGTHTISNTIYCVDGVASCTHLSLAVAPYNSDINSAFWRISIDKNSDDSWSLTEEFDPDDFIGDITWTTQIIDNRFLGTSVTIDFKKPMDGNMLIVQPWDSERGSSNFLFNDGIAVLDSYAYPTIESEYEEQLIVQKLCLYEDPNHRTTCAFAKKVDMEIEKAEMVHDELLNNNVLYKLYS